MTVVESIRNVLSGETGRELSGETGRELSEETDPAESGSTEPANVRETRLYRCEPCGTTYVSDELESCSRCDAPVERVPTEQDLGLI